MRQRADREAQRAALEAQRLVEQQRAARAQREDEIRRRAERQAARGGARGAAREREVGRGGVRITQV